MEAAFAEMPLALFSTLAPVGAGAFLMLAIAFTVAKPDADALRRIDRFTAIPVALVAIGFIAAFFHLASPMNAFSVFEGIGRSPLSNELVAGCTFAAVMLIYWIWAVSGKMADGVRKGLAWVVAAVGLVFALFTGVAYMIDTIPSWNTIAGPVQMIGFALLGGAAVGVLVLALSGCADQLRSGSLRTAVLAVVAAGLVLGIGGFAVQATAASGMSNPLVSGADLVASAMMVVACGIICLVGTGVCDTFAVRGAKAGALVGVSTGAVVMALVGILLMRLAFYTLQISVGLSIM